MHIHAIKTRRWLFAKQYDHILLLYRKNKAPNIQKIHAGGIAALADGIESKIKNVGRSTQHIDLYGGPALAAPTLGNKSKQNGSKSSSISQWLIVHLQVRQHATRCANLIREITFANADKVFVNRLPSLKDRAVTVFSFNRMHLTSAALRYLWRVSFSVKPHISPGKLPRNI